MSDFAGVRMLSFDCYGTLIDWETGIVGALRPWAERAGLAVGDGELLAAHARHETAVQQEMPAAPYPEVLAETMRRIGADLGGDVAPADAAWYGASVGEWPAFPDAGPALRALQARFELAILSNVDRASFTRSSARLGVAFDVVVTAEDVGSYKPDPANFAHLFAAGAARGVPRQGLLHVAESLYHDHEPAARLGLPSVWIHRRAGREGTGATAPPTGDVQPSWEFPSMAEFAAAALASDPDE